LEGFIEGGLLGQASFLPVLRVKQLLGSVLLTLPTIAIWKS